MSMALMRMGEGEGEEGWRGTAKRLRIDYVPCRAVQRFPGVTEYTSYSGDGSRKLNSVLCTARQLDILHE